MYNKFRFDNLPFERKIMKNWRSWARRDTFTLYILISLKNIFFRAKTPTCQAGLHQCVAETDWFFTKSFVCFQIAAKCRQVNIVLCTHTLHWIRYPPRAYLHHSRKFHGRNFVLLKRVSCQRNVLAIRSDLVIGRKAIDAMSRLITNA